MARRAELSVPSSRAGVLSPALLPLFREIGDLKRVHSAGRRGSIAERLFGSAWAALVAGRPVGEVTMAVVVAAVAATRLGDLDPPMLSALGVTEREAVAIRCAAIDALAPSLPPALIRPLRAAAGTNLDDRAVPPFVGSLADQPRAGITCPGKPRIVLQPPESHADHCLVVAVYGVLLAPSYEADPETVFLAALAHHLHNAALPDAGFTGETLLGSHLAPAMERATSDALAELPDALRRDVIRARRILPDDATAEGRAFHAADTIDRVLEIEQHLAAARLTMATVLGEMELVHAGPTKAFQDRVLTEVGLL